MRVLSDEKIGAAVYASHVDITLSDAIALTRAIEAAVLEELAKQKPGTKFNVGRFCLSEDDCIEQGIPFFAYERGVADAAVAFDRNDARNRTQVPIAWQRHKTVILEEDWTADDHNGWIPLYAAPVVPPDMVMVPREPTEAMLDAAMNRYKHVSPEAKARYTQMHRENFRCDYKAMIAAAEQK